MSAPDLTHGVRSSDAERERIAQVLQGAAAEGRLSPEEAGERLASASTATFRQELERLVADLPAASEPDPAAVLRRARPGPWLVWGFSRVALIVMLVTAWWGFWGFRMMLWPLGLVALIALSRPWRRRRWRMMAWRGRRPGWDY
jgi:hypothetical protein